ncbi:MAG: DNA polymerase III subunit gamma/tau [Candidatus Binataceae bacterium]
MAGTPSSHLVLARKWRPERFGELVGQEHVTRTLERALQSGRIAHAFLFTGIRGVGKTTAARILARCLNCHEGPAAEPCGKCAACLEVRAGTALDVVEIDGATYRKIDDARAIIENLGYRPARDRFKIYIIDEAHQLTDQAFNALLKTLEEPPAHVKFILATTEPQKMPETILSRLQRYDFRRIPFTMILGRLKELIAREEAVADDAALRLLAREAGGSMRDAERMLETALASLDGKVLEGEVASILGVASRSRIFDLIESILGKQAAPSLDIVRGLYRDGANLESLGRDLLESLRNLAIAKLPAADGQGPLADMPDQEAAELRRLAENASARDLMRLFHLMADTQERIMRSPYPDMLLEMAVIRMASLAPVMEADELIRAINSAGSGTNSGGAGAPPSSSPANSSKASRASTVRSSNPERKAEAASAGGPPAAAAGTGTRRLRVEGEVKADAPLKKTPGLDLPELRDFIRRRRAALAGFMEQGAALELEGDLLTITARNDIYVRYLGDNRTVIAELASELYGRPIRTRMVSANAADDKDSAGQTAANADDPASHSSPATESDSIGTESDVGSEGRLAVVPDSIPSPPNAQMSPVQVREAVLADPVVRRIFNELDARLVEVKTPRPDSPSEKKL